MAVEIPKDLSWRRACANGCELHGEPVELRKPSLEGKVTCPVCGWVW